MSKISKRVSKYLISRLNRAARLEAFGQAVDAGITVGRSGILRPTRQRCFPVMSIKTEN